MKDFNDYQIDPTVIGRPEDLNPKSFPVGSVVFFLARIPRSSQKYVSFGTVIEHYAGEIALQLYELRDARTINGVPVKDFKTPSAWQKLPKDWTWRTRLFEVRCDWNNPDVTSINFRHPESILKAIADGSLVPVAENDHAVFREEIDWKNGWRIVRDYSSLDSNPNCCTLPFTDCYGSCAEAAAEMHAQEEELKRQAALSDREWSIEQIDRDLDRWARLYQVPEDSKQRIRTRLLALDHLEDVVTRLTSGGIEWKYDRGKRWYRLEP